VWSALVVATLGSTADAYAAEPPPQRRLSTEEIEAWLEGPSGAPADDTLLDAEAPPPPPRSHGFTVESGIGALGHLGDLKKISPVSPWFHLKLGYEPFSWLMAFVETDLVFSNTSYARPPPNPRTYRLYSGGFGLRGTLRPWERFGLYVEASAGGARVSEDVLSVYGYREAAELNPYFGGRAGLEWYPVNPHLAASLHGGVRSFDQGLGRERGNDPSLAWVSGLSLRYTF